MNNTLLQGDNLACWLDDPQKKAGRVNGDEGGQVEIEMEM